MKYENFMGGIVVGLLIALVINVLCPSTDNKAWQGEAIQYHHAYYHPNTGEFTWKKDCK